MPATIASSSLSSNLKQNGQEHLLTFFEALNENERQSLLKELEALNLPRIQKIFVNSTKKATESPGKLEPLPSSCFDSTIRGANESEHVLADKIKAWELKGLELIRAGKVGVLLLAGGQGTRLGSSSPKGCYDIGLPSHKSLFQMQGERINRLQKLSASLDSLSGHPEGKSVIPWYVMTSGPTHNETVDFFKKNNFFGLSQENVFFFQQGTLPCFSNEGKILLETKSKLAVAPDGNGGCYAALEKEGVLKDMESRGVEHVHMYCVDNCLVRVADPVFIGYCVSKGAECGAKVVPKLSADEPVGVVCQRDGKFQVVEYSEIDKDTANKKNADGSLSFRAANIANHYYTRDFLVRVVKEIEPKLEYHIANKKIPTVDLKTGDLVKPSSPNGIKLELFVFDVFPHTRTFAVLEVPREQDFSPLKNPPGNPQDSPDSSRRDIMSQHKQYLEAAGAHVLPDPKDQSFTVEISPLVTYAGEGLQVLSGLKLQCPILIQNEADLEKYQKSSKA